MSRKMTWGRDIPSWRRICNTLIKNDFWYRTLSFSPNKPRYLQRMKGGRNGEFCNTGDTEQHDSSVLQSGVTGRRDHTDPELSAQGAS